MTLSPNDPRHGTTNGYCNLKCRCSACKAAWAEYCRGARNRRTIEADDARHGTTNGYWNYGCRCEQCVAAGTMAKRAARERRPAAPKAPRPVQPCGTAAAYGRHLRAGESPCDACRSARAELVRSWRKRRRAS